jgi:fatty-acyl-CoA synthase
MYTSGTTGVPKGIVNTHGKLRAVAQFAAQRLGLTADDVGYVSMPLFHSNSLFLNWLPAFTVGASVALQEKFTASGFVDDVFRYGVTYWNYVGQPVHYVLEAAARQFGPEDDKILKRVRDDPRNRLRAAVGTGAGGPDRARFIRWFGLDHVYEMYGSTEAEISTCCMPGDPHDSVGEVIDPNVVIMSPEGVECPPAQFDPAGNVTNMREAVGEIVRRGEPSGLFQGYHGDAEATARKFSGGMYHSGDLGMCRVIENRRYLYFVGRTSDWIRKDGENFSAECVVDLVSGFPGLDLAAAYGAPHPVSDEWVMVALRMRDGRPFDPQAFFDHCEREDSEKGKDAKGFPDLVRIVTDVPWTETHKILTRQLKTEGYDPRKVRGVYLRRRGDRTYRELTGAIYAEIEKEFRASGRLSILNSCV